MFRLSSFVFLLVVSFSLIGAATPLFAGDDLFRMNTPDEIWQDSAVHQTSDEDALRSVVFEQRPLPILPDPPNDFATGLDSTGALPRGPRPGGRPVRDPTPLESQGPWTPAQASAGQTANLAIPPANVDSLTGELFVESAELPVPRFKKQAVQTVTFSGGWLGATDGHDLSSSFFEASIGLGIPLGLIQKWRSGAEEPSFETGPSPTGGRAPEILGITPTFRIDMIDAAEGIDIPSELYDTGVSVFYRRSITDRFSAMAIVRPSVRSDFTTSDNAIRIFGLGLLNWDCVPEKLSLSVGAVYLDRADLPLLPAVGLTWTPRTTTRLELRFPQSSFAWRLAKDGSASETWMSLSAGIGGNTWAVTRSNGETDVVSLGDIRVLLGVEHIVDGGGGWFADIGYAFNRHYEFESDQVQVGLSDGFLVQAGWRY